MPDVMAAVPESPPAAEGEAGVCSCGAGPHPKDAERCSRSHYVAGNQAARIHGFYSARDRGDRAVSPMVRQSADEMVAAIVADLGGNENITAQQRQLLTLLRTYRLMHDHAVADIVDRGMFEGRHVRPSVVQAQRTGDRMRKILLDVGLERRARQVPSLEAYLAQVPAQERND